MKTLGRYFRRPGRESVDRFESDYPSPARGIMVGGSSRSGTTLLRVMLDSHRHICCGPESWLFVPQPIDRRNLVRIYDLTAEQVEEFCQRAGSRAEFIDRFFADYCRRIGKPRWAEKTPKNVEQLSFVFRSFPNARFIHIIRDGRDVACSLRTHPRFKIEDGQLVPLNTWKPMDECAARWAHAIRSAQPHRSDSRYLEVRYEDLVLDPRPTLEKVLAFVEEPWDDQMLHYYEVRSAVRDVSRLRQNPEATEPLKTDAVGRWRRDMIDEDKAVFKQLAGDLLIELGYETSSDW